MGIGCHVTENVGVQSFPLPLPSFLFALSDPEEDFDITKNILTRMAHQPELDLSESQHQYYRVRQKW